MRSFATRPGWAIGVEEVRAASVDPFALVDAVLDADALEEMDLSFAVMREAVAFVDALILERYGVTPEEMLGVLVLVDEHPDAVAYDLMRCGTRLREFPDGAVSWLDLATLIRAAQPDSAIFRAVNPNWSHTPTLELLRRIEFYVSVANWQRAGGKGRTPEPYSFPWEDRSGWHGDALEWDEAVDALGGDERLRRLMAVPA